MSIAVVLRHQGKATNQYFSWLMALGPIGISYRLSAEVVSLAKGRETQLSFDLSPPMHNYKLVDYHMRKDTRLSSIFEFSKRTELRQHSVCWKNLCIPTTNHT